MEDQDNIHLFQYAGKVIIMFNEFQKEIMFEPDIQMNKILIILSASGGSAAGEPFQYWRTVFSHFYPDCVRLHRTAR